MRCMCNGSVDLAFSRNLKIRTRVVPLLGLENSWDFSISLMALKLAR